MSHPRPRTLRLALLAAVFLTASQSAAYALFDLSVSPRRGGQTIRFDASNPGELVRNEEVTVSVDTNLGAQYRIHQTVYQPLMNESGQTIPQSAFIMFSPSNPSGTLRPQLETPVTMGQYSLYTSDGAGSSESFVLVFAVRVPENQAGGSYRTQISFTAEPVTPQSGASQVVRNLDVRLDIHPEFRVDVRNDRGGRDLAFEDLTRERPAVSGALNVSTESNLGGRYRIVLRAEPLSSPSGDLIDTDELALSIVGGGRGAVQSAGAKPLQSGATLLYTSSETGESDAIQLQLRYAPDTPPKAGIYAANFAVSVETAGAAPQPEVINVPVRLEVQPIFNLEVEAVDGSQLNFGTFKADSSPQERQVRLKVYSNLGEPYQVSQVVSRKLTNADGTPLPAETFTFHALGAKIGRSLVPTPAPVKEGETPIFVSDSKGSPESLVVHYTVNMPATAKAGSYNSDIKYSLTTL